MTRRVTLTMSEAEAEATSFALSDLLCWCAGFAAGREGTHLEGGPLGIERARDLNIKLKSAMNALERTDP